MMQTEEGKTKMAAFTSRMEAQKSNAAVKVDGLSREQRQGMTVIGNESQHNARYSLTKYLCTHTHTEFFNNFADSELVSRLNKNATNPVQKIQKYVIPCTL